MLSDAIRTLLASNPAIVAMVHASIYPPPLPEASLFTLPAISYFVVSELRDHSLTKATALARPRIQIDVWANTKTDMHILTREVRRTLDFFHGTVSGVDPFGAPFTSVIPAILMENRQELYEPDTKTQHTALEFFVWNDESREL